MNTVFTNIYITTFTGHGLVHSGGNIGADLQSHITIHIHGHIYDKQQTKLAQGNEKNKKGRENLN